MMPHNTEAVGTQSTVEQLRGRVHVRFHGMAHTLINIQGVNEHVVPDLRDIFGQTSGRKILYMEQPSYNPGKAAEMASDVRRMGFHRFIVSELVSQELGRKATDISVTPRVTRLSSMSIEDIIISNLVLPQQM